MLIYLETTKFYLILGTQAKMRFQARAQGSTPGEDNTFFLLSFCFLFFRTGHREGDQLFFFSFEDAHFSKNI